jgi:hypothetical protein
MFEPAPAALLNSNLMLREEGDFKVTKKRRKLTFHRPFSLCSRHGSDEHRPARWLRDGYGKIQAISPHFTPTHGRIVSLPLRQSA